MGKLRQFIWIIVVLCLLSGCTAQSESRAFQSSGSQTEEILADMSLKFPYTLPDGLVAEQLISYTGEYWEDGSGERVEQVAALMIYNPTDQLLGFGAFAVEQDGQQLYFFVHRLPPKGRCLILEYKKNTCKPEKVLACRELRVRWEHPDFSREQVDYVCLGPDMTVINRDARVLNQVTVWYKLYDRAGGYYIGGIAYAAYLHAMQPEERRTVRPEHYDTSDARIVGIEYEI